MMMFLLADPTSRPARIAVARKNGPKLQRRIHTAEAGACSGEADATIRTADPFITSEVLYQLSYVGGRANTSRFRVALSRGLGW